MDLRRIGLAAGALVIAALAGCVIFTVHAPHERSKGPRSTSVKHGAVIVEASQEPAEGLETGSTSETG